MAINEVTWSILYYNMTRKFMRSCLLPASAPQSYKCIADEHTSCLSAMQSPPKNVPGGLELKWFKNHQE